MLASKAAGDTSNYLPIIAAIAVRDALCAHAAGPSPSVKNTGDIEKKRRHLRDGGDPIAEHRQMKLRHNRSPAPRHRRGAAPARTVWHNHLVLDTYRPFSAAVQLYNSEIPGLFVLRSRSGSILRSDKEVRHSETAPARGLKDTDRREDHAIDLFDRR